MIQLQALSSKALGTALNTAAKCMSKRNTLVILDNVLLSKNGDKFYFTTGTNDSQLTIVAPLTVTDGKFEKKVALPVASILSYLSALPDCVVNITLNDDYSLKLTYALSKDDKVKSGEATLTYLDGDEFPLLPSLQNEGITHVRFSAEYFANTIAQSSKFAANDELRPQMNSMLIDISDATECYFVATDGHTLVRFIHATPGFLVSGNPCQLIISNTYFKALSAFDGCNDIDIESDGKSIRFSSGDIEFMCKALEGVYPKYSAVIPKNNPFYFVFNKKEMIDTVKRVNILGSASTQLVKISKDGMFAKLEAKDIDFSVGSSEQVILYDSQCNEDFRIGISASKFIDALSAIDSDEVRMQMADPTRAMIFTSNEASPRVLTLCMPMMLED